RPARDASRDRWRVRREERRLPRAPRGAALEEDWAAGAAHDEPHGGPRGHRAHLGHALVGAAGGEEGWDAGRGGHQALVRGRRVPGFPRGWWRSLRPRAVPGAEPAHPRLRRGGEPPEGGGLP